MRDIATKAPGSSLTGDEFNDIPSELENAITSTGITLSAADLFQLGKAVSNYAGSGDYYTDGGVADAYVLSAIGAYKAPTAYRDGMRIRFEPVATNTAVSTVNVNGLGAKTITESATVGSILIGISIELVYNNSSGQFEFTPEYREFLNTLISLGITPAAANEEQLADAMATYAAVGDYYTDSGSGTAYVLSPVGDRKTAVAYTDGMTVRFRPDNSNSGSATVNVNGLGVKNITGTSTVGTIVAGEPTVLEYNSSSGEFKVTLAGASGSTTPYQGCWLSTTGFAFSGGSLPDNIDWDVENRDTDAFHAGTSSQIIVPAAANGKQGRLVASIEIDTTGSSGGLAQLYKIVSSADGDIGFDRVVTNVGLIIAKMTSPVVDLSTGDIFTINISGSSGSDSVTSNSFFDLEVIQ